MTDSSFADPPAGDPAPGAPEVVSKWAAEIAALRDATRLLGVWAGDFGFRDRGASFDVLAFGRSARLALWIEHDNLEGIAISVHRSLHSVNGVALIARSHMAPGPGLRRDFSKDPSLDRLFDLRGPARGLRGLLDRHVRSSIAELCSTEPVQEVRFGRSRIEVRFLGGPERSPNFASQIVTRAQAVADLARSEERGPPTLLERLVDSSLNDPIPEIRAKSLESLGHGLRRKPRKGDGAFQGRAYLAIAESKQFREPQRLRALDFAGRTMMPSEITPTMLHILEQAGTAPALLRAAIMHLGRVRHAPAAKRLVRLSLDGPPVLSATIATALGSIGDPIAESALIRLLLGRRTDDVRIAAARALAAMGTESSVSALHAAAAGFFSSPELKVEARAAIQAVQDRIAGGQPDPRSAREPAAPAAPVTELASAPEPAAPVADLAAPVADLALPVADLASPVAPEAHAEQAAEPAAEHAADPQFDIAIDEPVEAESQPASEPPRAAFERFAAQEPATSWPAAPAPRPPAPRALTLDPPAGEDDMLVLEPLAVSAQMFAPAKSPPALAARAPDIDLIGDPRAAPIDESEALEALGPIDDLGSIHALEPEHDPHERTPAQAGAPLSEPPQDSVDLTVDEEEPVEEPVAHDEDRPFRDATPVLHAPKGTRSGGSLMARPDSFSSPFAPRQRPKPSYPVDLAVMHPDSSEDLPEVEPVELDDDTPAFPRSAPVLAVDPSGAPPLAADLEDLADLSQPPPPPRRNPVVVARPAPPAAGPPAGTEPAGDDVDVDVDLEHP